MNTNTRTRLHDFCLRGVTLSAADAPRLETRLRAILATGTTRRNRRRTQGVALAATVGLAGLLAVVRPGAPDAHAAPPPVRDTTIVAAPGKWTQTVDGVTLELAAVSERKNNQQVMWTPDGSPLAQPLYDRPAAIENPTPQTYRVVECALRITVATRPARYTWLGLYGLAPDSARSSFNTGGVYVAGADAALAADKGYRIVSGLYKRDQKTGTVRVLVAGSAWSISENWNQPGATKGREAFFYAPNGPDKSPPYEVIGISTGAAHSAFGAKIPDGDRHYVTTKLRCSDDGKGGVKVTATDTAAEYNSYMVAFDKQGKRHIPSYGGANSDGKVRQSEYFFPGLPISNIDSIEFVIRPYRTVEFRNVPLAPKTN